MEVPRLSFGDLHAPLDRIAWPFVARLEQRSEPPFKEVLAAYPTLIHVISHGHAFSFVPLLKVVDLFVRAGGADRRFLGAGHRFFFLPIVRRVGVRLTQTEKALSFDELVERLRSPDYNDLFVMPEGDHCLFGDGLDVVPFTSPRFVELALRVGVPLLLSVHQGSEVWARSWPISERRIPPIRLLPQRMREVIASTGTFTFPIRFSRLPVLRVRTALYHPRLRLEELNPDRARRRAQLWEEAERVRARMQEMLDALKAEVAQSGSPASGRQR